MSSGAAPGASGPSSGSDRGVCGQYRLPLAMMAPWWVPCGPRSCGCSSWMSCGAGLAERDGPGCGVAVGVAGVGGDVAQRDALAGHGGQDGSQCTDRVEVAGGQGHPAGEFGHRRAVFLARHGGGGHVVAEEHLASGPGQVGVTVPPGGFGAGACGAAVPGRPGPGLHVGPVGGQRGGAVFALAGDAGFQQVIADASQVIGRRAAGLVFAERHHYEVTGVLDLPVGELVRAVFPVLHHAEPGLVGGGQRGQHGVHLGEVGGPAVVQGEHHPGQ